MLVEEIVVSVSSFILINSMNFSFVFGKENSRVILNIKKVSPIIFCLPLSTKNNMYTKETISDNIGPFFNIINKKKIKKGVRVIVNKDFFSVFTQKQKRIEIQMCMERYIG